MLMVFDAQFTDHEYGYQATQEQEAQSMAVLHLAWSAAVLHNCPNKKQWATRNYQAYASSAGHSLCNVFTLQSVCTAYWLR